MDLQLRAAASTDSPLEDHDNLEPATTTGFSKVGPLTTTSLHHHSSIGSALARHQSTADASSLAGIDRPPSREEQLPPAKVYHPMSPAVLALLMPASVFGVLARLGIVALVSYDGRSIFPLAYAQALGCLIMGVAVRLKDPIGGLCVSSSHTLDGRFTDSVLCSYGPLYTSVTTGKILRCRRVVSTSEL